ncbi:MAG: threonine synthase [Candidatus Auribacterota bacterium]|nr:threonine synthase [Candidatus Auribacterota bacterium]
MMKSIRYYSTNRNLRETGLKPFREHISFREALLMGQAPDGGLFMPDRIPRISPDQIAGFKGQPYWKAALEVGKLFWGDSIPDDILAGIFQEAYNFEIPIENVYDRKYIMRLDHGPTASFKDFAARLMSRLMSYLRDKHDVLKVLVATSGDTGSAIGEAFKGVEGIDVYILYPETEVSPRQKKQLDTIGGNVTALMVEGKFDDCQKIVKEAFLDPELSDLDLTSANSINIGRILPQSIYYIWGYAQIAERGEEAVICVPSGNFGNAFGCELAWRMGLPMHRLLMPTNENNEFPRFLDSGSYRKVDPSRKCLSNAMNVGHPSNLARFFDIYGGNIDKEGDVHGRPDLDRMRERIFSVSVSDEETRETIRSAYRRYGLLLEPHGAVGWKGLERYLESEGDFPLCLSIETAHPAKFPDEIEELLGIHPPIPDSLRGLEEKNGKPIPLPNDYRAFKELLLSGA